MKKILIGCTALMLIITGIWFIVLPEDLILTQINAELDRYNLVLEMPGFKKGPFFSFHAPVLQLKRAGDLKSIVISLDDMHGFVNPLYLILMRLPLSFSGSAGTGKVKGEMDLLQLNERLRISIDGAGIEHIPLFNAIGLSGSGTLSGGITARERGFEYKFSIKDAHLGSTLFNIPLPLNRFCTVRGLITTDGDVVGVKSLWMEGQGINAKIKGVVKHGRSNLTLELMKDSSFTDSGLLSLIEPYKISPGYYVLPLNINLY